MHLIRFAPCGSPNEVAAVATALTQFGKLEDAILKAAGYYEVFSVKGPTTARTGATGGGSSGGD